MGDHTCKPCLFGFAASKHAWYEVVLCTARALLRHGPCRMGSGSGRATGRSLGVTDWYWQLGPNAPETLQVLHTP
jgi:hypothetical protein